MAVTLLLKRRSSGGAGAPASLKSGEVAVNEVDGRLYYGAGNDGSGNATAILELGGAAAQVIASWEHSSNVAAVDFTSIPATYSTLLLQILGLSGTSSATVNLRVSVNNGSSFLSASGDYVIAPGGTAPSDTAQIDITASIPASEVCNAVLTIDGYALAGPKLYNGMSRPTDVTEARSRIGIIPTTSIINALRVYFSTGNVDAGTINLYGLR